MKNTKVAADQPRAAPVDLDLHVTTVRNDGNLVLKYRLSSPSDVVEFRPATIHSASLHDPDTYRDQLHIRIEKLREGKQPDEKPIPPADVPRELEKIGGLLFERLFPRPLRDAWDQLADVRTLQITSNEPWIPWELVKAPRETFFCLRFCLSRVVPEARSSQGIRVTNLAVIEAAEIDHGPRLAQGDSEVTNLVALAHEVGAQVRPLRNAVLEDVEALFRGGGYQLYHFVGHGEDTGAPDDSQFLLSSGRPLRSGDLVGELVEQLKRDRPLVVLNACQVGRLGWSLTGLGGWAERWLLGCDAAAFLGPQWKVDDRLASDFVECFYEELREGQPLGEALREARQQIRQQAPFDLTWLAYSLYANPNAQVVFGDKPFAEPDLPKAGKRPKLIRLDSSIVPESKEQILDLPAKHWDPERSPPGALLRADYGVVPFHFRQQELADLLAWCRNEASLQVKLFTGPGGMGKTRLAFEVCHRLRAEGWQAGFFETENPEKRWQELAECGGPQLLVVDYAETRRDLLVPLIARMRQNKQGPIRLILLARAALDWWQQLKEEGDGVGELLGGPATEHRTLRALALDVENRSVSYNMAADAFAEKLEKERPRDLPPKLGAEYFERVLLLHMNALAVIDGVSVKDEDGILDHVLRRESRFWKKIAKNYDLTSGVVSGIGRGMAIITLGGGVDSEDQAVEALYKLRCFHDQKYLVLANVARILRQTYPGPRGGRWIEPVQPDLLGEHLIQRQMEEGADELLDIVLGPKDDMP